MALAFRNTQTKDLELLDRVLQAMEIADRAAHSNQDCVLCADRKEVEVWVSRIKSARIEMTVHRVDEEKRMSEQPAAVEDKERLVQMKLEWRQKKISRHDGSFLLGERRLYLIRNKNWLMFFSPFHVRELGKALIEAYRTTQVPYGIDVLGTSAHRMVIDKFRASDGNVVIKITQFARFSTTLYIRCEEVPIVIRLLTQCLKSETFQRYEKQWSAVVADKQATYIANPVLERRKIRQEMSEQSVKLQRDVRKILK